MFFQGLKYWKHIKTGRFEWYFFILRVPIRPPKHNPVYLTSPLQILSTMLDCDMVLRIGIKIPRHSRSTNLLSELASHVNISHQDNTPRSGIFFASSMPLQIPFPVIQESVASFAVIVSIFSLWSITLRSSPMWLTATKSPAKPKTTNSRRSSAYEPNYECTISSVVSVRWGLFASTAIVVIYHCILTYISL